MPPSLRLAFALAAALCAPLGAAFASNIGVATAVLPAARGTPPAESARILHVGVDIAADERIETDADGKAHLIFRDGSALTIGPNSDLVLDEYVYDPDQALGRAAMSVSRGVLRFVGGGISKRAAVEIRTPTATMGIRGGVAILEVGRQVAATFLFGSEMTLSGGGVTRRVDRPGFQIVTDETGVPQNPVRAQIEQLTMTLALLETTRASAASGAPQITDDDVSETQIELLNSTGALGEIEPAAGGAIPPPLPQPFNVNDMALLSATFAAPPPGADEPGETPPAGTPPENEPPPTGVSFPGVFTGRAVQAGADAAGGLALLGGRFENGVFLAETGDGRALRLVEAGGAGEVVSSAQPFGPEMLSGTYFALSPQYLLFHLVVDGAGGRVFAFAGQPTAAAALPIDGVSAYPLFGDFVSGRALPFIDDIGPAAPAPGRVYVAWNNSAPGARRAFGGGAVAIFGSGSGQQAASAVSFGEVLGDSQGRPHVRARLFGQRSDGQSASAFYSGGVSSSDAGDGSDLFGPGANFVLQSAAVDVLDDVLAQGVVRSTVGGGSPVTRHAQHATGLPIPQAGARTTRALTGFAGGVERQFVLGAGAPAQNGAFVLSTVSDDRSRVSLQTDAERNDLSASFAFFGSVENVDIGFGGPDGGAFIDDRTFFAGTGPSTVLRNGLARAGEYAMITASELQHDGLLPAGVSFCVCEHLVWGFFGGQRNIPPSGGARWRTLELATWLAGDPVDPTQIAQVQQATYSGHLIGSVARSLTGPVHQAVGGLSLTFDFAPGSYGLNRMAIDNFDGMSLVKEGGVPGAFAAQKYSLAAFAAAHPVAGAVTINMQGAFYGPGLPAAAPANTGGAFTMQGASYRAAGTFAAALPPAP